VRHQRVIGANLAIDDPPIRADELLKVVIAFSERIREALSYAALQMQNDLRVFRIVLIPGII